MRENGKFRYGIHKCSRGPHWWTSKPLEDLHLYIKDFDLFGIWLITLQEFPKAENCTDMILV